MKASAFISVPIDWGSGWRTQTLIAWATRSRNASSSVVSSYCRDRRSGFPIQGLGKENCRVIIEGLVGQSGWLLCVGLTITAFETEDHLLFGGLRDDGSLLDMMQVGRLCDVPGEIAGRANGVKDVQRQEKKPVWHLTSRPSWSYNVSCDSSKAGAMTLGRSLTGLHKTSRDRKTNFSMRSASALTRRRSGKRCLLFAGVWCERHEAD